MSSSALVAVVGGNGGVGSSTFSAALAQAAGSALLVDLDPVGGGIDVLLGIEAAAGARWSEVRVGGGRLDPADLRRGLPCWQGVGVLALDGEAPAASSVIQVLDAGAALDSVVVADLGRAPTPARQAVVERADIVVLVATAQVRDVAAARRVLAGLGPVPIGLVVRRGAMAEPQAAASIGTPLLGVLPARHRPAAPGSVPSAVRRVAAGILEGVQACLI